MRSYLEHKGTVERVKQYIVRKYVMAKSASEAIRKEGKVGVDDVWLDDKWLENNPQPSTVEVGFKINGKKKK